MFNIHRITHEFSKKEHNFQWHYVIKLSFKMTINVLGSMKNILIYLNESRVIEILFQ